MKHIYARLQVTRIVLALMSIVSYLIINNYRIASDLARHTEEVIAVIHKIRAVSTDCQTSIRGYVISRKDSFLTPYYVNEGKILPTVDRLQELTQDNPEQQNNVRALRDYCVAKLGIFRKTVSLAQTENFEKAAQHITDGEGEKYMNLVRRKTDQMLEIENSLLKERAARSNDLSNFARWTMPSLFLIAVLTLMTIQRKV
jgi:CHASE3 domain sensor protein